MKYFSDKVDMPSVPGRRSTIVGIAAWILGTGALQWPSRATAQDLEADTTKKDQLGEQLVRDLARLEGRDYSQEGIPMFLACEIAIENNRPAAALASNATLVSAFRRLAETLPMVRPDATESDVAKLVELLADQDFAAGGKEGP